MTELPFAGRTALVTGPTSGIGRFIARGLAEHGATVVLACRDAGKGEETATWIRDSVPEAALEIEALDLMRFASVRACAAAVTARHDALHLLVNNAGIYTNKRTVTEDGHEATWQVNHLSHHLLTSLLMPSLLAAAPARVVNVASEAHRYGRMFFDDPDFQTGFRGGRAYGQSKLANILFTRALAARFEAAQLEVFAAHPGVVRTAWARQGFGLMQIGVALAGPFMLTPEQGARTPLYAARAPALAGTTGAYFVKGREARPSSLARDPSNAERLWAVSEAAIGAP